MVSKPRNGNPRQAGQSEPLASRGKDRPAVAGPYRSGGSHAPARRRDPQPVLAFLKGGDLWAAYQRLCALQKDLQQIQPQLTLTPLKLADQVLVVTAGSAAVAARLRQVEPSLVEGLRARGWLVARIRFRPIAVHDVAQPPPARTKEPVSQAALKQLQTLDDAGLNPELQAALSSFVRRQKSYLGS